MVIQSWATVIIESLQNLWLGVAGFVPSLIGSLVILLLGLVVATGLGSLVEKLIVFLRLDDLLAKLGIGEYFERAGLKLNSGRFFGLLVYWFLVIAFILAASDVLGLYALSSFLSDVLLYLPNIVVAILIMLAAVILANFAQKLVKASVMSARLHAAKALAALTWWSIIVFGLFATLMQLGIAVSIINTLMTGFIAMIALAGGIAFGLGGKEHAAHLLERLRSQVENNK
ncbi:MAG: hypothetical protein HZA37_01860 [Parcubacteria group bacterium]|nr:hypothetical protein [Parcubacteria group bacterium]